MFGSVKTPFLNVHLQKCFVRIPLALLPQSFYITMIWITLLFWLAEKKGEMGTSHKLHR